jgi:hypothetical protein
MTDQTNHERDEGSDVTPEEAGGVGQGLWGTIAKLGAGEKMAVLGAAGVLAVWLVFDLLIDEYSTGHLPFALALVAAAAAYYHHNRGSDDWSVDYKAVILVTCALTGIIGAWSVIEEVRNDVFDADGATLVGALLYYVASIASGVGAWQLSKK